MLYHSSPRREVTWLAGTHIRALEWIDVAGDHVSTDITLPRTQHLSQQIGLTDIRLVNPYCLDKTLRHYMSLQPMAAAFTQK